MKRLILFLTFTLSVALAGTVMADTVQVDDAFKKSNKWLRDNNLTLTGSPSGQRDDKKAFSQGALLFYGEAVGNPKHRTQTQRETMAKRAAVVVAQRAMAEYLEGFVIVGDTMVKDGMVQYDVIRQGVAAFLKGVQVVVQEYNKEKDTAVAIVKMGLHGPQGFASVFYEKMSKDPELNKAVSTDKPVFKATSVVLDQAYDGLIIDATGHSFQPALINRIFSAKGEVLYDPAKVSQKVLIEQGCGEYTNSVEKAKAALESRGVKNPLVVKASGTTSKSDLQVSEEDAVAIFSANQKGNFMAGAKVAFVLK